MSDLYNSYKTLRVFESFSGYGSQSLALRNIGVNHEVVAISEIDNYAIEENFRIRKLTPRECFRLMSMKDSDIDKIQQAGISNSQQYKMAGNSIVIDVLEGIFKNLFL